MERRQDNANSQPQCRSSLALSIPHEEDGEIPTFYKTSESKCKLTDDRLEASQIVTVSDEDRPKVTAEEQQKYSWSQLLPELLQLIASNLVAEDLWLFRAVCKSWSSIIISKPIPPPFSPNSHPQIPYLLSAKDGLCNFFHPLYSGSYQIECPKLLPGARIRHSAYGWLLISQSKALFFLNPITSQTITLPGTPDPTVFDAVSFSSPPDSRDCCVVFLDSGCRKIGIIKRHENHWTLHDIGLFFILINSHCRFLHRGSQCYYYLSEEGKLGVIDLYNGSFAIYNAAVEIEQIDSLNRIYMVKTDDDDDEEEEGELLIVLLSEEEEQVSVFGFNFQRKVLRRVESLGNKTLYVSFGASFLETATVKGMRNTIYFTGIDQDHNDCIFYSLETKKYRSFIGGFSNEIPVGTKDLRLTSTWFKPTSSSKSTPIRGGKMNPNPKTRPSPPEPEPDQTRFDQKSQRPEPA